LHTSLGLTLIGAIVIAAVSVSYVAIAAAVFLAFGFLYGGLTGCIHELPIRPWMTITTLREGVWLRVKDSGFVHVCIGANIVQSSTGSRKYLSFSREISYNL